MWKELPQFLKLSSLTFYLWVEFSGCFFQVRYRFFEQGTLTSSPCSKKYVTHFHMISLITHQYDYRQRKRYSTTCLEKREELRSPRVVFHSKLQIKHSVNQGSLFFDPSVRYNAIYRCKNIGTQITQNILQIYLYMKYFIRCLLVSADLLHSYVM